MPTKFHLIPFSGLRGVALINFIAWGINILFDVGEFEHCEHYCNIMKVLHVFSMFGEGNGRVHSLMDADMNIMCTGHSERKLS